MPTQTEADHAYEDLYQRLVVALPADSEHLVHNLDGVVRERLAEAEQRVADLAGRAVLAVAVESDLWRAGVFRWEGT